MTDYLIDRIITYSNSYSINHHRKKKTTTTTITIEEFPCYNVFKQKEDEAYSLCTFNDFTNTYPTKS